MDTLDTGSGAADEKAAGGGPPDTADDGTAGNGAAGNGAAGDGAAATPAPPRAGSSMPHFGLAVICFVLFLTFLDNTIISASLGDVQS